MDSSIYFNKNAATFPLPKFQCESTIGLQTLIMNSEIRDGNEIIKVFCRQCEGPATAVCYSSKRHMRQIQKITKNEVKKIISEKQF